MRSKNAAILSLVVVLLAVAIFGTVAYGIYNGLNDGQHRAAVRHDGIVTGAAPVSLPAQAGTVNSAAAPGNVVGVPTADLAIAQPAPGNFNPGGPPYGGAGGVAADGLSAWGIAYKETGDANAQADATLLKAAYQDAEKRASDLAAATGNKLGKLVALTDYSSNQPYFKPCVQNYLPPKGIPVPQGTGAAGSGSAPSGSTTGSAPGIAIAPAPCQVNGGSHYLVAWVFVRHAL